MSKKDLSKLNKAELIELLENQAEALPDIDAPEEDGRIADLQEQVDRLTAALLGKMAAGETKKEDVVAVRRNAAMIIVAQVEEGIGTGVQKDIVWPNRGDVRMLTPRQLADLQERAPHVFEKGQLVVVGAENNPNVIPNFDGYLEGLKGVDAHTAIAQLTDVSTLRALLNHIEAQRFVSTDANGKPLVDSNGQPKMDEVQLPAWKLTILTILQRKLNSMGTIQATTDSPE